VNTRKAIGLALIPAIIICLTSCGKGTDSPFEFEKKAMVIGCESSGMAGGGTFFRYIVADITKNTGPDIEMVDDGNTEVSNADFNSEVSNYNFTFDLLDNSGNKLVSSSKIEYLGGGRNLGRLIVSFPSSFTGEATGYVAYLDGKEIASENNLNWVDYPGGKEFIIDGKCENPVFLGRDYDVEDFIYNLPWCKDTFVPEACPD
jgi:hypothetical protein